MNEAWIESLLASPGMTRMGHGQRIADANLGLGWIYYGLARTLRPRRAVVIGSYRGFVPLLVGRALADNAEGGQVCFIDPSLVDDFWKDAAAVSAHFASFGLDNVEHHLATTQQFVASESFARLGTVGMLFVDGYHTRVQARFDFESFRRKLAPQAVTLFHDSVYAFRSGVYGPERTYVHDVREYMDELKRDPLLQVFDLPFGDGLTLVRALNPPPPRRSANPLGDD